MSANLPIEEAVQKQGIQDDSFQSSLDHSSKHELDNELDQNERGKTQPPSEIRQDGGVGRIEALYLVFGKGWGLYSLWISIGLIAYVYSLSRSTTAYYAAFATSSFGDHTVISTIGVIKGIVAGVAPPFIAKLADVWSRPHALLTSIIFYTVGYAMCAGAHNIQTVVAGQFIYTIGNTGITFLNSLIIADITSLQWRGFVDGAVNLPYVLNGFVAGFIVDNINGLTGSGWRWGYGMFCIILPVAMSPALIVLLVADHRAKKLGTLSLASSSQSRRLQLGEEQEHKRTGWESLKFYWTRLNCLGLLLMGFAFALLLTPFTLAATAKNGYKNPSLIAMLVIGGVLFIAWGVWDGFFAEYPLMPRRVFNRTLIACALSDVFYFFATYLVLGYYTSWIWVITDYDARDYGFFGNTLSVTQCFFAIFFGMIMRYTHRYKNIQIFGQAVRILGMGLIYYSCKNPSTAVNVSSQVLIGFGASASVICSYIGVQASVPHSDMAIATAVLNLWSSLGSSVSLAIAAAVWNKRVPEKLTEYLGSTYNATEIADIFGSIYIARLTEPRDLVKKAYLEAVEPLWLAGLICSFGALIAVFFASNYNLDQRHNVVENNKIIKFRDEKEIAKELGVK